MILTEDVIERVHRLSKEALKLTALGYRKVREDTAEAEIGTGYALFAGDGSPLTQIAEFGHRTPGDVRQIEEFFSSKCENWEVSVTPFTDPAVFRDLLDMGYRPAQFEGMLAFGVDGFEESAVEIREMDEDLDVSTLR